MKIKPILKLTTIALLSWVIIHLTVTIFDGLSDRHETADLAVVLGNKVNENGTLSTRLTQRLLCGLDLYKAGRVKYVLVSGGLGKEGFYEGDKMKEFLIANGVPDSAVFVDNKGNNTLQTVRNTLELKTQLSLNSVIVVSQYYHLTRSKMLFKKHGLDKVSSVSPAYFEIRDLYALGREFIAYYVEIF